MAGGGGQGGGGQGAGELGGVGWCGGKQAARRCFPGAEPGIGWKHSSLRRRSREDGLLQLICNGFKGRWRGGLAASLTPLPPQCIRMGGFQHNFGFGC